MSWRDILIECGEGLFGPRWQTDLADEMEVNPRTIRRWVAGDADIYRENMASLSAVMNRRMKELSRLNQLLNDEVTKSYGGWPLS